MKSLIKTFIPNLTIALLICVAIAPATATELSGTLNVDNRFEAYISTDDSVQGTFLGSGTNWPTTYAIAATLNPGQDYFLHIRGIDEGERAGFLGDFELIGADHKFANGLATLDTNITDWVVSKTGWSSYQPASAYGANGVSPWGNRASTTSSAQWIWSSNNDADNVVYFSTRIVAQIDRPIADYRFDECSYSGVDGEVIDEIGNFNADSNGIAGPVNDAIINKSLDLSANNVNDWLDVPSNVVDGLDDFTIALWFNTSTNKPQQEIFHALGNDANDDELEIYLKDNDTVVVKVRDSNQELESNVALTDGSWHHLALSRVGKEVCLFIDGALQECGNGVKNGKLSVSNANAVVIGQEQDSFGGSFSIAQNFVGQLDEFKIFDLALSAADINGIYSNEVAGRNSNGSARDAVQCEIICNASLGQLNAVGIRINGGGSNSQINNTSEALSIHAAWLAAGSPASGAISGGTYNVAASGSSTVDRIDFGGSQHDFSDTLPYPGASAGVSDSDFLVHTSGIISLPAGSYTIFVESDDGFSFVMNTLEGDTISFNKFGGSASASNELRFENPTGNSNTGGSFTLTQDSVFDITAIFFERGGGDYLEVSIRNDISTSAAPAGYEILRDGALGGKVKFGQCPEPAALLEYRFEETNWNGSASEIIDNTGNGFDARVNNNASPETATPAIPGNPGTCGYADLNDGAIQVTGLPLDTTTNGVKTTVTFWMNWDGTDSVMPIGWYIHDIWMFNGSMGFNSGAGDIYGISSAGLANSWHHVAVEFTNGSIISNRIYIDGVDQTLTQRRGSPNNSRAYVDNEMRIGGWSYDNAYDFHGLIDEVRVYQSALSATEIQTIMAKTHTCSVPVVHHYEISHDGEGLTCDAESVTIKACSDASCSILSPETLSLDFLADGAIISSPTFTGSTAISFNNTEVETLTFSLANASIAASNAVVCDDGTGSSCDMVFKNAGFRFLSGAGNSTTLPNQTSGAIFADTLKLQAVEDTNGVCTGLFSGNKSVDLSQENVDPGGTSGLSFTSAGVPIDKHSGSTNVTLSFGPNSIATIPTPIYNDAGQIRLRANYNIGGITLSGSSNPFWVSPARLIVSAKSGASDLNGASATAATTIAAGDNFDLTVTAYNAASTPVVTPNYSPGQIQFMLTRTGPTLTVSVDGDLSYAAASDLASSASPVFQDVTLSNFSAGVSTYNNAQYSEVGLLNLDVQDNNYGNVGIVVSATAINIGRFTPDHFKQTVADNGFFAAACNATTAFTAYSGQKDEATNSIGAISYLTNPVIAITAYNKQGNITRNYYQDSQGSVNDFMKLGVANVSMNTPTLDQVAVGVDANLLPLTANMTQGTLSQNDLTALPGVVALPKGVLHYQLSDADNFFYNRSANALVAPFTSDIDFSVAAITDADNVNVTTTVDASPTGVEIRFARLVLGNSFGPETSNFPQPMQLEHFDGTGFIISSDNNCSNYDASKMSLTNISLNPALTPKLGGAGSFQLGKTQAIELQAPGAGNQGQIGVSYDAYDWLKYDWDNDGVYDDSPSAIATFGIYRGNDRIIHWREVFE